MVAALTTMVQRHYNNNDFLSSFAAGIAHLPALIALKHLVLHRLANARGRLLLSGFCLYLFIYNNNDRRPLRRELL